MKYIFDFDDVLFHNTAKLKPHMYKLIGQAGIPEGEAQVHYLKIRESGFKMKNFLKSLFEYKQIKDFDHEELYHQIMGESKNFINSELAEVVEKLGRDNCYIVTHGETEHQLDKINRTDLAKFFSEIFIVQGSKKEAIEKICAKHPDEEVMFIDDKAEHFENLDYKKYPNLKTVLYTGQDLSYLLP